MKYPKGHAASPPQWCLMNKFGYSQDDWNAAKEEMRNILIDRVRNGPTISYSKLAECVTSIHFEPDSLALHHMLDEISMEEDSQGRGMLSVIVVQKDGEMKPGSEFFDLAKKLGRDTSDTIRCWAEELRRVSFHWPERVTFPKEWLRKKVEIREIVPEVPIQKREKKRQTLKLSDGEVMSEEEAKSMFDKIMMPGDEIWFYCSSSESWGVLCGRSGYALVRDGEVIETTVGLMS